MLIDRIARVIQNRRKELKITQLKLSMLSGVGMNTLSRIEQASINPQLDTLEKIFDVLGMELELVVKKMNS